MGIGIFYLGFRMGRQTKWLDAYPFVISLVGSGITSLLLKYLCKYATKPVCSYDSLRAQVFGVFVFPLIIITFLWIVERLPILIKRK